MERTNNLISKILEPVLMSSGVRAGPVPEPGSGHTAHPMDFKRRETSRLAAPTCTQRPQEGVHDVHDRPPDAVRPAPTPADCRSSRRGRRRARLHRVRPRCRMRRPRRAHLRDGADRGDRRGAGALQAGHRPHGRPHRQDDPVLHAHLLRLGGGRHARRLRPGGGARPLLLRHRQREGPGGGGLRDLREEARAHAGGRPRLPRPR